MRRFGCTPSAVADRRSLTPHSSLPRDLMIVISVCRSKAGLGLGLGVRLRRKHAIFLRSDPPEKMPGRPRTPTGVSRAARTTLTLVTGSMTAVHPGCSKDFQKSFLLRFEGQFRRADDACVVAQRGRDDAQMLVEKRARPFANRPADRRDDRVARRRDAAADDDGVRV